MDELSGTTAADFLSGHHDATASASAPTWAVDVSPAGTNCPSFGQDQNFHTAWTPTMAGDFSVAVFAKVLGNGIQSVINFNTPTSSHLGWAIGRGVLSSPLGTKFLAEIGDGTTTQAVPSDNANTPGVWYWLVLTRSGGTFTFYVNAVAQSTTYAGTYSDGGPAIITIGYPVGTGTSNPTIHLSYAAVWTTRALSSTEITTLYGTL